ncbi:hypothetical protein KSS87_010767 [Heliosperma pusillum]|nr:hypothetical protein KSS87_010767 [Heliosperma pusillum]
MHKRTSNTAIQFTFYTRHTQSACQNVGNEITTPTEKMVSLGRLEEKEYIYAPNDIKPKGYDTIPNEIPYSNERQDDLWNPRKLPNATHKGPWIRMAVKEAIKETEKVRKPQKDEVEITL